MSLNWWRNETHRGTPVVVKMENPNNWSMVELESPSPSSSLSEDDDDFVLSSKGRNKNAKQLTWVLLLKAHRAAGCITSIAPATFFLASAVRRRLSAGQTDVKNRSFGFYSCIKIFLWVSILLLAFEIAAYFNGWSFGAPDLVHLQYLYTLTNPFKFMGFFDWVYSRWVLIRVGYLAPPLQLLANACIYLFLIQSLDRLVLCLGCFWIRFKKIKPVPKQTLPDLESGDNDGYFPMVLVQIPMCNEKEVNFV